MDTSPVVQALQTVQSDVMAAISGALPIAATVFASLAGIMIGFKFFKRITGARP